VKDIDPDVRRALAATRLLALDVDGTLTDGSVVYLGEAAGGVEEEQRFCARDGQGLAWLRAAGVRLAWITGRGCAATEARAAELGVDVLRRLAGRKDEILAEIQKELGIPAAATVAMGDDLPDLALARHAHVFCCPADAAPEVRVRADHVTAARGGHGAVRELCEAILRARGEWDALVGKYGP
jgi:3-deoxy-D-manno-octulosonate 8-phosphate phosphatase (KDO 8-P phosphatase)